MKRHFHYQKGNVSKYSRKREGFEMSDMSNVFILDHPLIQHKISRLRDENTGTNEFRKLIEEIAMLMGYEALRDLPMEDVEIKTPIETCKTPMIAGKKMAIVPILRAGLGMVGGILALVPSAKVGHIGLYRDPETHEPHEYYCKLPEPIDQRTIVVLDPMLATGGSGSEAVDFIKQHGGKNSGSVSGKTDYILAGDNMGPAKLEKAAKLGVKIINEDEFLNMIAE